jgi:hypothetical protein
METIVIEHAVRKRIESQGNMLDYIWYLRNEYYRMNGLHPTMVIMSKALFSELKSTNEWCGSYRTKNEDPIWGSIFGLDIQVDFGADDDEIRIANAMVFRLKRTNNNE